MLTSPAADDSNPWQAFRPTRHASDNGISDRDHHQDDKRTTPSTTGETKSSHHQDGNANANTCRRQFGRPVENYDRKKYEYVENVQITQDDLDEKYVDSLSENGAKQMHIHQNGFDDNNGANLFQMNLPSETYQHSHLSSSSLQSQYGHTVYVPLNNVSVSDTCIFLPKRTNQSGKQSAFRKVYRFNDYHDIPAVSGKTDQIQNDNNGNYFSENYQFDKQYQSNVIECNEDELIETVPNNVPNESKGRIDPFLVYREHIDREDDYLECGKSTEHTDSLCSVSSGEIDEYEELEWDQHTYLETDDVANKLQMSEASLTFIDLSFDKYQTAPSTPDHSNDQPKYASAVHNNDSDIADIVDEFFELNAHSGVNIDGTDKKTEFEYTKIPISGSKDNISDVINIAEVELKDFKVNEADNDAEEAKLCRKCGKVIAATTPSIHSKENLAVVDDKAPEKDQPEIITNQADPPKVERIIEQPKQTQRRELPRLQLPTPPYISVDSLYYEADPETGTAKVIGRGSFGQVYKARFSDSNYYHLPIVVKEFNGEFSNSRDIIEEAQRLYYLYDTGFVPACYGLLCLDEANRPRYGIVQEYIGTGLTLEQLLWDQVQFRPEIWLSIAFQCCEGLSRFHTKGILLNDIKTNNIIMEFRQDFSINIKFIDFGLATDMRGKRYKNTKSLDNYVYLAPEVRKNGEWTDIASDIFSLGYMLGQLYSHTGLSVLELVANLSMDMTPDMRLPVQGASSLIQDSIIQLGFDPGALWLNMR